MRENIQHTALLMENLSNKVGGNADFNHVGGKGASAPNNSKGRVKELNPWNDEW